LTPLCLRPRARRELEVAAVTALVIGESLPWAFSSRREHGAQLGIAFLLLVVWLVMGWNAVTGALFTASSQRGGRKRGGGYVYSRDGYGRRFHFSMAGSACR